MPPDVIAGEDSAFPMADTAAGRSTAASGGRRPRTGSGAA